MAKHLVKCPRCQEIFDTNEEPFVHVKRRYYHEKCYQELTEEVKKREAVALRQELVQSDRDELFDFIKEVFGDEANWGSITRQINFFMKNYNYSYREIYLSLLYFFEVQHGNISKSNGRIGIVPYVHDEAIEHYRKIAERQFSIAERLANNQEEVVIRKLTIAKEPEPEENPNLINMEDLI